jgi:hypothetical protein
MLMNGIHLIATALSLSAGGPTPQTPELLRLPTPTVQALALRQQAGRAALQEKGLLSRLPKYDPTRSLSDFAVALEKLCGASANKILKAADERTLVMSLRVVESHREKTGCVMMAIMATGLQGQGVDLAVPSEALPSGRE